MNSTQEKTEAFHFGPFRVCTRSRQLSTEFGPVALGARAFDLLAVLLGRDGQLLSKQELLDLVWAGQAVEESNLHVQIAALRRALGAHQGLIQNIPGRGYRFAGTLTGAAAAATAPAARPRAKPVRLDHLATSPNTLVGRDVELAELQKAFDRSRLVTLIGPGGVGKTHLAASLMQEMSSRLPNAVHVVDFAPLADEALVESAVLAALDLRRGEDPDAAETIAAALTGGAHFLLLDNCEHVLNAVAALTDALLRKSALISIIATSREPLRAAGETIFRIDPLAVPPRELRDIQALRHFGAVELFILRATACDRRFQFNDGNAACVSEICRNLDGIPLALEMAAARVPSLGVEGLRDRLQERLRVLTIGARTASSRHQTLRDTVAWSYDLLDPADRAVFRGLSIFAGGFTLEAAVAVALPPPVDDWLVVDSISRLVDKSMVVAGPGEKPRYRLLATLRLFATEETAKLHEHDTLAARHAAYIETIFEDASRNWETVDDEAVLARMSPELDNLRAALDWAVAMSPACLISLARSSAFLWDRLSLYAEGRRYVEQAEAALDVATPPATQAGLYLEIGSLWLRSDHSRARTALERAEALYRSLQDRAGLGATLAILGILRSYRGDAEGAASTLQEARRLLRGSGYLKSLFTTMNNLGSSAAVSGDLAAAREFFEEALALAKSLGSASREAWILMNLGEVEFCRGDVSEATRHGFAAVGRFRALGEKANLGWALVNLTTYLLMQERPEEAHQAASEALALLCAVGGFILRVCLQHWALLAAINGKPEESARLLGFVDFGFEAAGETREHAEQQVHHQLLIRLESQLPNAKRSRLADEGASWTESEAVKRAAALRQNK